MYFVKFGHEVLRYASGQTYRHAYIQTNGHADIDYNNIIPPHSWRRSKMSAVAAFGGVEVTAL